MGTIKVGQKATRSIILTTDHVKAYAEISGDYNPLHFNEDFARKTKFGKLVVQGGLTTGLLHALVAMDMPGPGTVFLSQNWKHLLSSLILQSRNSNTCSFFTILRRVVLSSTR